MEFRKPSDYDVLKDSGMSPAEIRAAIDNAKKEKDRADKLETDLNATKSTLNTMESSFKETKDRLNTIEANFNKKDEKKEETRQRTSFIDNEDEAFNERFNERVGPVALTALTAAKNSAKLIAKQSLFGKTIKTAGGPIPLSRLWEKWEMEIENDSKQVALAALGDPQTWINMFNYIKGKHIDELMAEPQTFIEHVEENTNRTVREDNKDVKLNSEEEVTIAKMSKYSKHVTPESYKKTKDGMKFVNV
jgi:hypothetical protein